MFEKAFCRELIELGYKDAMAAKNEILQFLEINTAEEKEVVKA